MSSYVHPKIDGGDVKKYDWEELKKEFLLSSCKSVSSFLREKNIANTSYVRKMTKSWKVTKRQNNDKIVTKTIEKVIEKEAAREADKITSVKNVALTLLAKIEKLSITSEEERDLKTLTSALKDISDIMNNNTKGNDDNSFAKEIEKAWRNRNE